MGRSIGGLRAVDKTRHNAPVRNFLLALLTLSGLPAAAGPWMREAGAGSVTLSSTTFRGGNGYDDDGGRLELTPLSVETVALDAEVGLGPRLLLLGRVPFVVSAIDDAGSTAGFGDAVVGLQFGVLTQEPFVVSVRGDVKLPLYAGEPTVAGRQPKQSGRFPGGLSDDAALGDGQVDVTGSVVVGGRFPFDGFFAWDTGYRFRSDDVSDAVVGGGDLGVGFFDGRVLPSWNLRFVYSMDPRVVDDVAVEAVGAGAVVTGPAVRVAVPEVVDGLAANVGAGFVFRGRNAAGGFQLVAGVSYEF